VVGCSWDRRCWTDCYSVHHHAHVHIHCHGLVHCGHLNCSFHIVHTSWGTWKRDRKVELQREQKFRRRELLELRTWEKILGIGLIEYLEDYLSSGLPAERGLEVLEKLLDTGYRVSLRRSSRLERLEDWERLEMLEIGTGLRNLILEDLTWGDSSSERLER